MPTRSSASQPSKTPTDMIAELLDTTSSDKALARLVEMASEDDTKALRELK